MAQSLQNHRPGGIIDGINMTPLVDIMLVLLVIFIVTAKMLVTPAIPMQLPKAAKTDEVEAVFAVIIPAVGEPMINGERIANDAALMSRAASALAGNPELRAVIQADGSYRTEESSQRWIAFAGLASNGSPLPRSRSMRRSRLDCVAVKRRIANGNWPCSRRMRYGRRVRRKIRSRPMDIIAWLAAGSSTGGNGVRRNETP